jgi:hypothetical protein
MNDLVVEKSKFDAVLRRLINAKPQTFKETVAEPKPRKDGGYKRSAKPRTSRRWGSHFVRNPIDGHYGTARL